MFNNPVRDGKVEKNPVRGVKQLAENNERKKVLTAEEWEEYKAHCSAWYLPVAITAYRTAMRRKEILNLMVNRLDLNEGFIRHKAEDTKITSGRSVPIHT